MNHQPHVAARHLRDSIQAATVMTITLAAAGALSLSACAVQGGTAPAPAKTAPAGPPASPMAAVARLTEIFNARGPSQGVLNRGAEFVAQWHEYVDGHQDA